MNLSMSLRYLLLVTAICGNIISSEPDEQKKTRNATCNYQEKNLTPRIMEHVKATILQITEDAEKIKTLKQQSAEKAMAAYLNVCDLIDTQPSSELIRLKEKIATHLRNLDHTPVTPKSTYTDVNQQWQWSIFRHCSYRRSCSLFDWMQLIPAETLNAIEKYFDEIPFRSSL